MTASSLRADCARCAALCCVALAFDRSSSFAFDKKAGEPCQNLLPTFRCRIHESLAESGFNGCAIYDCHGAGQFVTQQLFGGRSWRDDPRLLMPMMKAFAEIKALHETRLMVAAAMQLPVTSEERAAFQSFAAQLDPDGGWTELRIGNGEGRMLIEQVQRSLRDLRKYVTPSSAQQKPVVNSRQAERRIGHSSRRTLQAGASACGGSPSGGQAARALDHEPDFER